MGLDLLFVFTNTRHVMSLYKLVDVLADVLLVSFIGLQVQFEKLLMRDLL